MNALRRFRILRRGGFLRLTADRFVIFENLPGSRLFENSSSMISSSTFFFVLGRADTFLRRLSLMLNSRFDGLSSRETIPLIADTCPRFFPNNTRSSSLTLRGDVDPGPLFLA